MPNSNKFCLPTIVNDEPLMLNQSMEEWNADDRMLRIYTDQALIHPDP